MKHHFFTQSLLAAALALSISSAHAVPSAPASPPARSVSQVAAPVTPLSPQAQQTKQQLQQVVDGLQTAIPYYQFTLENFQHQGNQSLATINMALGGRKTFMSLENKVTIDHGLSMWPQPSLARVQWTTGVGKDSDPDLLELLTSLPAHAPDQMQGIITLAGELEATFQNTAPYAIKIDSTTFNIPSYTGTLQSYNQAQLARSEMRIPSLEVKMPSDRSILINNIYFRFNDKPIRNDYFELNGQNEFSLDKLQALEDGQTVFALNNLKYADEGHIDTQRLYQGSASSSGSGVYKKPGEKPVAFSYDITGTISNLHADSYVKLARAFTNSVFNDTEFDEKDWQQTLFTLLNQSPKIDLYKVNVTLNGHQGIFSYTISIGPLEATEYKDDFPFLLLLSKIKMRAAMDVPVQWFDIINDDSRAEAVIDGLVTQGFITRKDGRLTSTFILDAGTAIVNGKAVPLGSFF